MKLRGERCLNFRTPYVSHSISVIGQSVFNRPRMAIPMLRSFEFQYNRHGSYELTVGRGVFRVGERLSL